MGRYLILGAGVMGTAISVPLADNGHDVRLVGTHLDGDIIEELHESHRHPRLRSSIPESVQPYTLPQLEGAFADIELVILGVNSLGVGWASKTLSSFQRPGIPIVVLTKGLHGGGDGLVLLPELLRSGFPESIRDELQITAIGGPSIAGELAARRQTWAVLTGADRSLLDSLRSVFETSYYHLEVNTDEVGVEVSVGLKNLYALGVGLVQGMLEKEDEWAARDAMHNPAAALFTQSLLETAYLVEWMGGQPETVSSLAGVGDLYVTCQGGRNHRMGRLIGLGMTYEEAKAEHMPDETVEGAEIALAIESTVNTLTASGELEEQRIPLLQALLEVVCRGAKFELDWGRLFE